MSNGAVKIKDLHKLLHHSKILFEFCHLQGTACTLRSAQTLHTHRQQHCNLSEPATQYRNELHMGTGQLQVRQREDEMSLTEASFAEQTF